MLGFNPNPNLRRKAVFRRFIRRNKILIILFILLALVGTGFGGLWAYGKFKNRQSNHLTRLAQEYVAKGQLNEARMALETAIRLKHNNPVALRLLARIQGAQGTGSAALASYQKLAESGALTLQDLSTFAVAAAREGDWALAERLADSAARGGNPVLRHMLRAELLTSKKDFAGAEAEIRLAMEVDKSDSSKAALARFLIASRLNNETAPEILELLRGLSGRSDGLGAEALASAISSNLVPIDEAPAWIAALRAHPSTKPQFLLLADTADIKLNPQSKAVIAQKTAQRLSGASLEERAAGMQWLMLIQEPALASSMLTRDEALQHRETLTLWLDSNALQKRWDVIIDTLAQPNVVLPSHFQKLYRGRSLIAMGRTDEGRASYAEAFNETSGSDREFLETLAYLAMANEDAMFEQGLKQVLANPDKVETAMRALVPAVQSRRDAARVRRVYEVASASPALANNLTIKNDLDYLSLLLGMPVDSAQIALRSQANPRDFSFRVTNALALLRAGQSKQALQELENCEPDVHVASLAPHQQVVVVAALAVNGRRKEAISVASLIPPMALNDQEVKLLQTYLADPQPAPTSNPTSNPSKTTTPSKKPNPKKK
jgi:hypothetical protein